MYFPDDVLAIIREYSKPCNRLDWREGCLFKRMSREFYDFDTIFSNKYFNVHSIYFNDGHYWDDWFVQMSSQSDCYLEYIKDQLYESEDVDESEDESVDTYQSYFDNYQLWYENLSDELKKFVDEMHENEQEGEYEDEVCDGICKINLEHM